MSNKKKELIKYVDGCMEYGLPINRLTYTLFRISNGYITKDLVRNIQQKIASLWMDILLYLSIALSI